MPRLVLPVPEEHMAITRPVLLTVLRQLTWLTEITERVRIVFNGYEDQALTFDINGRDGDSAQFDHAEQLKVTITERPVEEWILTQDPHRDDALFVFFDPALNVSLKPAYHNVEYRITFEYRTEDRASANNWLSMMTTRTAMNRAEITHSAEYEYGIPVSYYPILLEIHRLREAQGGYGEDFVAWWNKCVSKKFTVLMDSAGNPRDIVFKEQQLNFLGWFDFTTVPEPQKGDGSTWNISFDYVVRFEKPTMMVFHYPFVIHNQLLPLKYSGNNLDQQYPLMKGDMSFSNQRYDFFRRMETNFFTLRSPVRIPFYDDWKPHYPKLFVSPLYYVLTGPNTEDSRSLLNLTQLVDGELGGHYELKPHFLEYIRRCGDRVFVECASVINICLYENNIIVAQDQLTMDADFNITTKFDMDLRKNYRVTIGVLTDLSMLIPAAVDELLNLPEVCLDTLKWLEPALDKQGLLPGLVGGRKVIKSEYIKAISKIRDTNKTYANADGIHRAYVGGFSVVTWSNE